MIVGERVSGSFSNATFSGTYFTGGMDYDNSQASQASYYVDGFYGSINANGAGTALNHQRVNPSSDYSYDYTFDDEFKVGADGAAVEPYENFWVGAGGGSVILTGRSTVYSLALSFPVRSLPASGSVYLNPVGVVNAASYAPFTNPITPGEMIRLYGSNLASSSLTASSAPFGTTLGGVSVKINGRSAPIYLVSPNQIVCIVPYGTSESYAQIQVTNNGTPSNTVTVFADASAPGVFTASANGIGDGATLHANGSLVTTSNPAKVGETVTVYVTGLGGVSPTLSGDGVAAPSNPLSTATENIGVFVDGNLATVTYAGLAPGFIGLYQINFTIPNGVTSGEVYLDIGDGDTGAYNSQATISVSQ